MKRYIACLTLLIPVLAQAHWDSGYSHESSNPKTRVAVNWMKTLPDSQKVFNVSIPGTHDSASLYGGPYAQTQTLDIPKQLKAGIRFLDIRLRSTGGSLAVHHGPVYQNMMFGDVLNQVKSFLDANPSEFVLMRVKEDHGVDPNFGDVVNNYVVAPQYRKYIWQNGGNYDPRISDVRGKIVFLKDYVGKYKYSNTGVYYGSFDTQDDWTVSTNWDLYSKWEKVRAHLDRAHQPGRSQMINWLSGSNIAFPYFVASGHSSPGTSAPRLATGLTTPGWSWKWKDFPRVNCWGSLCTIAFEGTNVLAKNYINKMDYLNGGISSEVIRPIGNGKTCLESVSPNNAYVGIVAADFPGPGLIEAVVDRNYFSWLPSCP